ncbi:MAG: PTS sugar transporter subunit IIA [Betaproteobacteria bacterium]
MVGILIIAHGNLGESLIHCATHVLGGRPMHLMQIGVTINDDPQQVLAQATQVVAELDQGDGILVLTDVFGATPANVACGLLVREGVQGVAGVNLPMLVRALTYRNEPLDVVVGKAISGGVEGVMQMPTKNRKNAATRS